MNGPTPLADSLLRPNGFHATAPLDCARCQGHGYYDGPGPTNTVCGGCSGFGKSTCFDCASPATVADLYADGDGPACADCATRCFHGCGEIAVALVKVADDQGDCEEEKPLCARCEDEEPARAKRIKRLARMAEVA